MADGPLSAVNRTGRCVRATPNEASTVLFNRKKNSRSAPAPGGRPPTFIPTGESHGHLLLRHHRFVAYHWDCVIVTTAVLLKPWGRHLGNIRPSPTPEPGLPVSNTRDTFGDRPPNVQESERQVKGPESVSIGQATLRERPGGLSRGLSIHDTNATLGEENSGTFFRCLGRSKTGTGSRGWIRIARYGSYPRSLAKRCGTGGAGRAKTLRHR